MRSPLLEGLIDYAGVFPPAALDVATAEAEYHAALATETGWVLGPMLVLASQVDQLDAPPRLGLVADVAPTTSWPLEQVERKVASDDVATTVEALRDAAPVLYLESAQPGDLTFLGPLVEARAAGVDVRAKVRTGGATAEAFPTPAEVAAFLAACVAAQVPLKATAGLHHPVRHRSAVPEATEHGFVNMLAATRCALAGDEEATLACLEETELGAFDLPSATWRGVGAGLAPEQVRTAFRSIGSCSFDEPTGYLRDIGML